MPDYRPNVLPKFAGGPNVADLLGLALDEATQVEHNRQERARTEPVQQLQRAILERQAYDSGLRPGAAPAPQMHAPAPLPDGSIDIFNGAQLAPGAPGELAGASLADALRGGGPHEEMLLPGQFKAEYGGVVKDPAQARLQRALDQGFTPDAPSPYVQLTDQYYLDPSATPAAREAQQAEVARTRAAAEAENTRARLRTTLGAAGVGGSLADLLAERPDLIDNMNTGPFAKPEPPRKWEPTTEQEARDYYDFTQRTEAKYHPTRPAAGEQLTRNQAYEQLKDLYGIRNPEGFIVGYSLKPQEMNDLADRMARGEHVNLPPQPVPGDGTPVAAPAEGPAAPKGPGIFSRIRSRLGGGEADAAPASSDGLGFDPTHPPAGRPGKPMDFGRYAGVGSSAPGSGGGWQARADELRGQGLDEDQVIEKLREEGLVR